MGPSTIFDKSALQALSIDETVWLEAYLIVRSCPSDANRMGSCACPPGRQHRSRPGGMSRPRSYFRSVLSRSRCPHHRIVQGVRAESGQRRGQRASRPEYGRLLAPVFGNVPRGGATRTGRLRRRAERHGAGVARGGDGGCRRRCSHRPHGHDRRCGTPACRASLRAGSTVVGAERAVADGSSASPLRAGEVHGQQPSRRAASMLPNRIDSACNASSARSCLACRGTRASRTVDGQRMRQAR